MAVADKTIGPRILESARKEFLEAGYEQASLKQICEMAGVTTGALYKRYSGKEELFFEVVRETVARMEEIASEKSNRDLSKMTDRELNDAWDMKQEYMIWWFRFLYERKEDFVLLIKYAQGTRYSDFQHDWVEKMSVSTYAYYQEAVRRGLVETRLSEKELHALTSAFWTTIYEPFIHDFTWEEVERHSNRVCEFIDWHKTLRFKAGEE